MECPGDLPLIAWGLAASRFPAVSLLAHEISPVLVARRNGLHVQDITLWLFGGVARLSGEARNPGAELRIAGVGPLVSMLLGGVFLGVAALLRAGGYDGLVLAGFALIAGVAQSAGCRCHRPGQAAWRHCYMRPPMPRTH